MMRAVGMAFGTLLAALSLVAAGPSGEPYTIDALVPLTGASAHSGQIHATALRIYENVANATGAIRGRPVHFEIHDDQSNSDIAVQLTNEILAKKPAVIMGSATVAACTAEATLVQNGPVEFCQSPGMTSRQRNVFASSIAFTSIVPAEVPLRDRAKSRFPVFFLFRLSTS
jgi:ABC-type branched-subunit amino acid transport system substrate-binding protein